MNAWGYRIIDNDSDTTLKTDTGFETEADAEEQAKMEIRADNIKNARIETFQKWEEL